MVLTNPPFGKKSSIAIVTDDGRVDPGALAAAFARRYDARPWRGYGAMARDILEDLGRGEPWDLAAGRAFGSQGSMGNGGAMRVAPVGAYWADDWDRVVVKARRSVQVIHARPGGRKPTPTGK
jgi:ADP-ribosylglycohydrolase